MERRSAVILQKFKNIGSIIAGTLLLSFGTAVFILPFELVTGGVSGVAIVLEACLPWTVVSVDHIITVLTWGLFFLGWILLGKDFAIKTLISSIVYPIGITLFLKLTDQSVLGGLFSLRTSGYEELAVMIAATVGGALIGVGCAVTFLCGGSTGGVDIVAFALCKYFKRLKSSTVIFTVDACIILLGMLLLGDMILSLLGIISAMISAFVIDRIFLGGTAAFVAQIVTDHYAKINQAVIERMERSTTIMDAAGGYSGRAKKMLTVSFSMRQYAILMQIVRMYDPNAFVVVYKAHEIRGEGWTR